MTVPEQELQALTFILVCFLFGCAVGNIAVAIWKWWLDRSRTWRIR